MSGRITINDSREVGDEPPSAEIVERLARDCFKTVVNLRTAQEANQVLRPEQERSAVQDAGMLPARSSDAATI